MVVPACNPSIKEAEVRGPGDLVIQGKFQLQTKFKVSLVTGYSVSSKPKFCEKKGTHIHVTVYKVGQASQPWQLQARESTLEPVK